MIHYLTSSDFETLIKCVKLSGGKLFGGVVRNLTMSKLQCRDVDVWFTSQDQREKFVNAMKESLKEGYLEYPFTKYSLNEAYPFDRQMARWHSSNYNPTDERSGVLLDLVVSTTFPCDDFTVNLLSYDGENFECHSSDFTVDDIKAQIRTKTAYMFEEFVKRKDEDRSMNRFKAKLQIMTMYGYTMKPLSDCKQVNKMDYY